LWRGYESVNFTPTIQNAPLDGSCMRTNHIPLVEIGPKKEYLPPEFHLGVPLYM
jgi:hypothetical protein